jgi:aspartyl protease family protein
MAAVFQQLSRLTPRLASSRPATIAALVVAALGMVAPLATRAQDVALSGRMGERALLVVDGQPRVLAVGEISAGVKLRRWVGDAAEVERGGTVWLLGVGSTPGRLGAPAPRQTGREIVLSAGPGGHFISVGAINGKPVVFMVDTGATLVSLSRDDAERLGLDLRAARPALTQTANGTAEVALITLDRVRVGDVELVNVGAAIVPQAMPMVLLGNSFLSRLSMRRDNDVMRLELR